MAGDGEDAKEIGWIANENSLNGCINDQEMDFDMQTANENIDRFHNKISSIKNLFMAHAPSISHDIPKLY